MHRKRQMRFIALLLPAHQYVTLLTLWCYREAEVSQRPRFSRNMTIPAFHSSAWHWYTRRFPVRHIHFLQNAYLLSKMFALLLFNHSGVCNRTCSNWRREHKGWITHIKRTTFKGGVYPDPTHCENGCVMSFSCQNVSSDFIQVF